jgi:hypothetical protein
MFTGLLGILMVYAFTPVAYTWYVVIGAATTVFMGVAASRLVKTGSTQSP